MDANHFHTLGECDFGTVWYVEGEGKVVVNAYQAALYFSPEDFGAFVRMIDEAGRKLAAGKEPPPSPPSGGGKIREFRRDRS